jgi:serine/threonine protein kinase
MNRIGDCLIFFLLHTYFILDLVVKKIGEGGFGNVYLCKRYDKSELVVIKCMKRSNNYDSSKKEKQFGYLSKMTGRFLVKYYKTFIDGDLECVVMHYFEDGNLETFINKHIKENQKISSEECLSII